jgi:hypothetical protein
MTPEQIAISTAARPVVLVPGSASASLRWWLRSMLSRMISAAGRSASCR